jgi:hypothetical protein
VFRVGPGTKLVLSKLERLRLGRRGNLSPKQGSGASWLTDSVLGFTVAFLCPSVKWD